jgi:hypothetical protein
MTYASISSRSSGGMASRHSIALCRWSIVNFMVRAVEISTRSLAQSRDR